MAKTSLKINNDFIFSFPKKVLGKEDEYIPNYIKKHFLDNYKSVQLSDEIFAKRSYPLPRNTNPETETLYLFEIEFTFAGKKIGGVRYCPGFTEDSNININLVDENFGEDEETYYLKFNISATIFWDFKSTHFNKYKEFVEKNEASWEDSKINIRLNFRNNFLHLNALKYDEKGNLNEPQEANENNISYILENTPNIFSLIQNYMPEKEWEKNSKIWQTINEKNIELKGNYFKHLL